jgi:uncharacterized membrane protein YqiK
METLIVFVGMMIAAISLGIGFFGESFGLAWWLAWPLAIIGGVFAVLLIILGLSLVMISERQVGIVVKKFSTRSLPAGRLVALNGEAGYQADTLAPGWHFGYWPWQYNVMKVSVTVIPQGEIALVVANDGDAIPPERILGQVVDCDSFQNARKFLTGGGEKGRQLGILTAGTYRINTALFNIITAANAEKHGMTARQLMVYAVMPDKVGVVTTLDGKPIDEGEIAGAIIQGHDNFQNGQRFIAGGGRRGLQEQVLLSGTWNLNPWFVVVEQTPMTEIPIGYVGVVISYVGKAHEDVSGLEFKHGDLVNMGHKGVWVTPLYPGKHPLNSRVMKVELVPTTHIVLNWANRTESHKYDAKLSSITVRSKDGFSFNLDVSQIIHVGALDAPKVISRVGSMQNLVDHVLEPTVGNYFRNSAQAYTVLDFLTARSDRQMDATSHIRNAIGLYDVEAVDTLIGDITPPAELMQTQTDRKIAEEQKKTYEVQEAAQTQRQKLVRETSLADIQKNMVQAEQGVNIAELESNAHIKRATGDAESFRLRAASEAEAIRLRGTGEAESIRLRALGEAEGVRAIGRAKAEAYTAGVQALGPQGYTAIQLMQIVGNEKVRVIPDLIVNGGGASSATSMTDALLGIILQGQLGKNGNSAPAPTEPAKS